MANGICPYDFGILPRGKNGAPNSNHATMFSCGRCHGDLAVYYFVAQGAKTNSSDVVETRVKTQHRHYYHLRFLSRAIKCQGGCERLGVSRCFKFKLTYSLVPFSTRTNNKLRLRPANNMTSSCVYPHNDSLISNFPLGRVHSGHHHAVRNQ